VVTETSTENSWVYSNETTTIYTTEVSTTFLRSTTTQPPTTIISMSTSMRTATKTVEVVAYESVVVAFVIPLALAVILLILVRRRAAL